MDTVMRFFFHKSEQPENRTGAGFVLLILFFVMLAVQRPVTVHAESAVMTVEGAVGASWPAGPNLQAEGAILMDADTGTILYGKNIHQRLYPASTTKMMTCLIAVENLDMNDTVTFSYSAVHDVPADGSNIGMDTGQTITVEQCLYGILVGSANECASAIAEKVAGSVSAFTDMMNLRAAELGCRGTHFSNANGLYAQDHYTTPYDLCLIGRAFFNNEILLRLGNTASYHFSATETQPDDFTIINKHKLINGEMSCAGIIGGKTGYTSQSGETLVTGCERGGMRLVCVVMNLEDPQQFVETMTLFDYGFSEFRKLNISENDTAFSISSAGFLSGGKDIFGSSSSAFSIQPGTYVDLPKNASFSDLTATLDQNNNITYSYGDMVVGRTKLVMARPGSFLVSGSASDTSGHVPKLLKGDSLSGRLLRNFVICSLNGTMYINVVNWAIALLSICFLLVVLIRLCCLPEAFQHARSAKALRSSNQPRSSRPRSGASRPRRDEYDSYVNDRSRYDMSYDYDYDYNRSAAGGRSNRDRYDGYYDGYDNGRNDPARNGFDPYDIDHYDQYDRDLYAGPQGYAGPRDYDSWSDYDDYYEARGSSRDTSYTNTNTRYDRYDEDSYDDYDVRSRRDSKPQTDSQNYRRRQSGQSGRVSRSSRRQDYSDYDYR